MEDSNNNSDGLMHLMTLAACLLVILIALKQSLYQLC